MPAPGPRAPAGKGIDSSAAPPDAGTSRSQAAATRKPAPVSQSARRSQTQGSNTPVSQQAPFACGWFGVASPAQRPHRGLDGRRPRFYDVRLAAVVPTVVLNAIPVYSIIEHAQTTASQTQQACRKLSQSSGVQRYLRRKRPSASIKGSRQGERRIRCAYCFAPSSTPSPSGHCGWSAAFRSQRSGTLLVALVFGPVNAFIRPIVKVLTPHHPHAGLVHLRGERAMLMLVAWLNSASIEGGFFTALLGSIVISIVSMILSSVLGDK